MNLHLLHDRTGALLRRACPAWTPRRAARLAAGLVAVLGLSGCNQLDLTRLYLANNGTPAELSRPLPLTLPYRDVDGWILLSARVNGRAPIDFVLDTGASVVALIADERTAHLDLDLRGVRRLGAAEDLAAPVGARQDGLAIDFGGIVLRNQAALAIPAASLDCVDEKKKTVPFNGVIGHDLFRRYTIEVDRDRGTVTLHDPDSYRYAGSGRIIPAQISARQPFVDLDVKPPDGEPYRARLHVDSGAGLDLTLFPGSMPAIREPAEGRVRNACFVGGRATYRIGAPVQLDLAGTTTTTQAEYAVGRDVVASGQNGRLGARFLARFNVVFDYARERIILEPRRSAETVASRDPG